MRRLVVLQDGTWQGDDDPERFSNVVRLRGALLDHGGPLLRDGDLEQLVRYDDGVGSNEPPLRRLVSGATGQGLSRKIRDAYAWIAERYEPEVEGGTRIVLVGFSRGAFSVRSLAGFIGAAGLLRAENVTLANLQRAWDFYRTPPDRRAVAEREALAALGHGAVEIEAIGVFDTVGALGIPGFVRSRVFNRNVRFHDTQLGASVRHGFHAVAIDENRPSFQATLWTLAPGDTPHPGQTIEQVWFPGVHGSVGGS